jgi:hypothetical protein
VGGELKGMTKVLASPRTAGAYPAADAAAIDSASIFRLHGLPAS